MSEYVERLNNAKLGKRLDTVEELTSSLTASQAETLNNEKPDQLGRIETLIPALRPRIDAADPMLVSDEGFELTQGALDSLVQGLEAFIGDGNTGHLNGIRSWTDKLARAVALWPASPELPSQDVTEITARFRRSAGQQLRLLTEEFDTAKKEIEDFRSEVDERTTAWQEQRSALEGQLEEMRGTIEQQRGRLDEAIERYQGQFSEAQERRNEEFRKELGDLQSWVSAAREGTKDQLDDAASGAEKKAAEIIESMNSELKKAQGITGFIGSTGTSAGYKDEADAQKSAADSLRRLAIAFGLAAAGLAIWAIVHAQSQENPSLTVVLAKALGSLVLVGIAGYIANQSGHHRAREEQARRRELDLVALPPFIASLPDDQKEDITGDAAAKLFVAQPAVRDGKSEPALTKESISLVGLLLEAIRKG